MECAAIQVPSAEQYKERVNILAEKINAADVILLGGGSGMSSATEYNHYQGNQIFMEHFRRFEKEYGFRSMFDGYYYLYSTLEEQWGFYSQYIKFMYEAKTGQPYLDFYKILKNKTNFILTTNVDMQFSKVFPEENICLYQGDFRYFQCSQPCHDKIYENETLIREMNENLKGTKSPSELIPRCSECGRVMTPWVRDYEFLEGSFWRDNVNRCQDFLTKYMEKSKGKNILFLELGVGDMKPSIIKLPFWKMTAEFPNTL